MVSSASNRWRQKASSTNIHTYNKTAWLQLAPMQMRLGSKGMWLLNAANLCKIINYQISFVSQEPGNAFQIWPQSKLIIKSLPCKDCSLCKQLGLIKESNLLWAILCSPPWAVTLVPVQSFLFSYLSHIFWAMSASLYASTVYGFLNRRPFIQTACARAHTHTHSNTLESHRYIVTAFLVFILVWSQQEICAVYRFK